MLPLVSWHETACVYLCRILRQKQFEEHRLHEYEEALNREAVSWGSSISACYIATLLMTFCLFAKHTQM